MAEVKVVTREPGAISFNYEELKAEISAKAAEYTTAVYSADNIASAKADRAKLNKLKTALNSERLKREREFMEPFMEFKEQVADLIRIIDEPIKAIDTQVKAFEENERLDRKGDCIEIFAGIPHPEWLDYEQIENPKWYNKTTSLSSVKEEIEAQINKVESEFESLANYSKSPVDAQEYYKRTLKFHDAMAEGQRIYDALQRKEQAVAQPVPEEEEAYEWVSFRAYLTPTTAKKLAGWMKLNGIKFEKGE